MSLASVEQIAAHINSAAGRERFDPLRCDMARLLGQDPSNVSHESASRYLALVLNEQQNLRMFKGARPWHIVNVAEQLPADQPWIGIEFETGFSLRTEYQSVINYVWHNTQLSTVDREGYSNYPCEFTFFPTTLDDFVAGNHPLDNMLSFMENNGIQVAERNGTHFYQIGMHVNFSTPAMREGTKDESHVRTKWVKDVLNHSLGRLNNNELNDLFGRRPYRGFVLRMSGNSYYIEGKLFNSTTDREDIAGYKRVIERICKLAEELASSDDTSMAAYRGNKLRTDYLGLDNLYEYLMGTTDDYELNYSTIAGYGYA